MMEIVPRAFIFALLACKRTPRGNIKFTPSHPPSDATIITSRLSMGPSHRASAAAYLASRARFGVKFGLEPMRVLLQALGHPEASYPSLLVAGTNGKGSVTAYVDAALRASGLRVGRYTSPHLVRVHERICVGGREITPRTLEALVGRVRAVVEAEVRGGRLRAHPTYFEVLTAVAFERFRQARVDVAVLEVGMGGRLDATNVKDPLASAIVSLAIDHEEYLGTRLRQIAREKAGILRPGRTCVLGPMTREARRAVAGEARRIRARLVDALAGVRLRSAGESFELRTPWRVHRGVRALPGIHQRENAVVAIRLLEAAREAGLPVDLDALPGAFARVQWPGRLQWIPGRPALLLDGAHNPAGARALARYLEDWRPFTLVFGAMVDKDIEAIGRILFPLADAIVLTQPREGRAAGPAEIARRTAPFSRGAHREAQPGRALALARRLLPPDRPVVVAGSLYLVGDVLRLVQ
jgi:dihydrofolate synthase / folylpolyglutamate synthase